MTQIHAALAPQTDGSTAPTLALVPGGLQQEAPIVDEFDIALEEALQQADAVIAAPDDTNQRLQQLLEKEEMDAEKRREQLKRLNQKLEETKKRLAAKEREVTHYHNIYGVDSALTKAADDAVHTMRTSRDQLVSLKQQLVETIRQKGEIIDAIQRELAPKPAVVTDVAAGLAQAAITAAEEKGQAQDSVPAAPQKKLFVLDLQGFKPRDGHQALVDWVKTLVEGSVNGFFPESFEMPQARPGAGPKVKVKERSPVDGTEVDVEIPHYLCGVPSCCKHHVDSPNRFAMMWVGDEKPLLVALCRNATQVFMGIQQYLRDTHRPVPNVIKYTSYEMAKRIYDQAVEEYKQQEAELTAALRAAGQTVEGTGKTGRKLRRLIDQLGSVEAATAELATQEAQRKARRLQISQQGPVGRQGDSGSSGGKKGKNGQKGGKKKGR